MKKIVKLTVVRREGRPTQEIFTFIGTSKKDVNSQYIAKEGWMYKDINKFYYE